jgi:hypothetical protein
VPLSSRRWGESSLALFFCKNKQLKQNLVKIMKAKYIVATQILKQVELHKEIKKIRLKILLLNVKDIKLRDGFYFFISNLRQ